MPANATPARPVRLAVSAAEYRRLYESGHSTRAIARALGISRGKVSRDMGACGIVMRDPRAPQLLIGEPELRALYVGQRLSADRIAVRLGTTARKIKSDLRRYGIPRRGPGGGRPIKGSAYPNIVVGVGAAPPDHTFFDRVDTDSRAYALGLLWADGCIANDFDLRLCLAEEDLELLQRLQGVMGGSLSVIAPQKPGHQAKILHLVRSPRMIRALRRWGLCERKDSVLPPVREVEPWLRPAFVRGLIDGDGSTVFASGAPSVRFTNRNAALRSVVRAQWEASAPGAVREYCHAARYWQMYVRSAAAVRVARELYLGDETTLALARKRAQARAFVAWERGRQETAASEPRSAMA